MRQTSDLPEFANAGRQNILLHVARMSGAAVQFEQPIPESKLPSFVWGLVFGAAAAVAVVAWGW